MTFVDFPKCAGLYTLTEAVEDISFKKYLGSGVSHFYYERKQWFIVRFLMRARMLVQVT